MRMQKNKYDFLEKPVFCWFLQILEPIILGAAAAPTTAATAKVISGWWPSPHSVPNATLGPNLRQQDADVTLQTRSSKGDWGVLCDTTGG